MITRFYVDNYKCLQNFEYKPKPLELIIGANGSGKSTIFVALGAIRNFVAFGHTASECFPSSSLTRWQSKEIQEFNIHVVVPDIDKPTELEELRYVLHIQHDLVKKTSRILNEMLFNQNQTNGGILFSLMDGDVHLYRDNNSEGPVFPVDWNRSALGNLPERNDNRRLTAFRHSLRDMLLTHINPISMDYATESENSEAEYHFNNFPSWYRHHAQENPESQINLTHDLREVLDGFGTLQLTSTGSERRELVLKSAEGKNAPLYRFDELSDGQRALIVLYSITHFMLGEGQIVCIDEPESYIALRELQPLITTMEERIAEQGGQILLISHHPEFINLLTEQGKCVRFYRENNGHTRIAEFHPESELTAAEIVARGWEDDEQ